MMEMLAIDKVNLRPGQFVPPLLESLVSAAQRGENLLPYIEGIVASFGFDSFEYGVSSAPHPHKAAVNYYYSTLPAWNRRYGDRGYVEIDPRIFLTCKSSVSARTVQFHFERIFGKLGAANRQEAVARGVQTGIVRGR